MVQLDLTQKFTVSVVAVQDDGSPGQYDGPPTYPVDIPDVLTMVPSSDGLSCECRANKVGTCIIIPTALANGKTIVGPEIQVTVVAPPVKFATKLVETITDPVPQ